MSKIAKAFEKGKAFIPFITCGDPDLETTERIVRAMAAAGADLIELGIPFSDPTAEGPVIQAAMLLACSGWEMPKPTAQGHLLFSRTSRTMAPISVVMALRTPVTPREDTM